MTRRHAALQLLALGPLQFREFVEITGWPPRVCTSVLYGLSCFELAKRAGREWRLA